MKGKYTVESLMENSDFSNIYTGKAGNKDIIIKECFPKSLVIRGSDNEVFTIKHKENFDLIKKVLLPKHVYLKILSMQI